MSTLLENFHKHRTTLNGQTLDVYYNDSPTGGLQLKEILDANTQRPVRTVDISDQKTIKDEIWGQG